MQTSVYERFGEIQSLAWIGLGFPLGSLAAILLFGRLYDQFNAKTLINCSIITFEVGSALCGAAPSMNALIVGRVIAGIGGCGMYIGYESHIKRPRICFLLAPTDIIRQSFDIAIQPWFAREAVPVQRPHWSQLGHWSNSRSRRRWSILSERGDVALGTAELLFILYFAFELTNCQAFYINLPLAALLAPVYLFITPSYYPRPSQAVWPKILSIDWLGVGLNAAMVVLFMAALVFSGAELSWDSAGSIALWTVAGVLLLAFAAQQSLPLWTSAQGRIFPMHFLESRDMVLLFIATACTATANAVTLYYIPLLFGFTRGDTALQAAVRLLPYICIFIFCVMFAGGVLPMLGRYSPFYILGGIFITIGSSLMFTIRADTSTAKICGYEVLIAAGSGLTFQSAYAVASAKVGHDDKSNAIGFINTAQIGTTALSLAIASCLYQNLGTQFLRDALEEFNLPQTLLQAALGGAGSTTLASAPPQVVELAISTVAFTISRVFAMNIAAGALMICASLLMRHEKINLTLVAGG